MKLLIIRLRPVSQNLKTILFMVMSLLVFNAKCEDMDSGFFDMSLDQLADVEITSVAKKPQKISLAASSIFVLNSEDIRRSGVTTIADALRLVPGVQVAKLDANKWAISIRGFNDIFSNKLLVLFDGRSVYSPFFGGAYWDTVDTVLADIDRIEVIRGPGGTLWGSNAVNGVINIITKKASETEGLLVNALAGNKETGQLSVRYGGNINQSTNYRLYIKGLEKDHAKNGVDDWRMGRAGFRLDTESGTRDKLTLQGDLYAGEEGEMAISASNLPPFSSFASKTDVFGGNVLFRWQRKFDDGSDLKFQTYFDRTERAHFYVTDKRNTLDFDFQHRFHILAKHELVWGLEYRYIDDETLPGTVMRMQPDRRSDHIYSGFVQDEFELIDERLILTVGSKFEHNSYTGFEYQPSARLLWKPFRKHSLWGAISRAVKIPSRMEQDVRLQRTFRTPTLKLNIYGNKAMKAEELLAYELGYRYLNAQFNFDMSLFYNVYENLRSLEAGAIIPGTPDVLPFTVDNKLEGEVYGFEVSANWQLNDFLSLQAGYAFVQMQLHPTRGSNDQTEERDEGDTPHHQFTLKSLWQINEQWQIDADLRYVDRVKEIKLTQKSAVDAYITADLRIAWEANEMLSFTAVGRNLFGRHREFRGSTVDTQATDVEPSLFFMVDFKY